MTSNDSQSERLKMQDTVTPCGGDVLCRRLIRPYLNDEHIPSHGRCEPRGGRGGSRGSTDPVEIAYAMRARAQHELAGCALCVGGVVDMDRGVFEGGEGGECEEVRRGGAPAVVRKKRGD